MVMARLMVSVEVETVLPPLSLMVTTGWVAQVTPLDPPPGGVVNTSWAGAPTDIVNTKLAADVAEREVESVAVRV